MCLSSQPHSPIVPSSMNQMSLQITIISADVLKRAPFFTKMRVYASVSLLGGAHKRQITGVDEHGGAKPVWNFPMKFGFEEAKLRNNSLMLVFQLRRRGAFHDRDIGLTYVPVKEIFDIAGGKNSRREVALPVSSSTGKAKGVVYLSYVFGGATSVLPCPAPSAPLLPSPEIPNPWTQFSPIERGILGNYTPSAPYMEELQKS